LFASQFFLFIKQLLKLSLFLLQKGLLLIVDGVKAENGLELCSGLFLSSAASFLFGNAPCLLFLGLSLSFFDSLLLLNLSSLLKTPESSLVFGASSFLFFFLNFHQSFLAINFSIYLTLGIVKVGGYFRKFLEITHQLDEFLVVLVFFKVYQICEIDVRTCQSRVLSNDLFCLRPIDRFCSFRKVPERFRDFHHRSRVAAAPL